MAVRLYKIIWTGSHREDRESIILNLSLPFLVDSVFKGMIRDHGNAEFQTVSDDEITISSVASPATRHDPEKEIWAYLETVTT